MAAGQAAVVSPVSTASRDITTQHMMSLARPPLLGRAATRGPGRMS